VDIDVRDHSIDHSEDGVSDFAETERARRRLIYDPVGALFLDLEWVLPRHRYALSWTLPKRVPLSTPEAITASLERDRLLILHPSTREGLCNGLRHVRDQVCTTHLACSSVGCGQIELGLYAFDASGSRELIWVAGTHSASSPFRQGRLLWRVGLRGLTMWRRMPHFASTAEVSKGSILYRPPSNCPLEAHILCVPIPLPRGRATDDEILANPGLPCLVDCTPRGGQA
jgi:hypothetical protein